MSDVDELVERYRVRLGLQPWNEHAETSPMAPRRTGRTTQALLMSIAECVLRGITRIDIAAPTFAIADDAQANARAMLDKLGIDIAVHVEGPRARRGRAWGYRDHTLSEMRGRR